MRRFDFLRESIPKYLENPHITEIIITDETGEDYSAITAAFVHPKLRVFQNERRLGAIANKQRAASYATSDYVAILDSDNFAGIPYFEAFKAYIAANTCPLNTVFLPCFAMPSFNYTRFIGKQLDRRTIHLHYPDINACLNTMNMIVPRAFLATYKLMEDTPWCVDADGAHDALYFSMFSVFVKNATLVVVPGMVYEHRVHGGSWYLESVERSRGVYDRLMDRFFPKPTTDIVRQMNLSEWQATYKDESTCIVQASSMNADDAWMPFPIGMQFTYGKMDLTRRLQVGPHDKVVLCALGAETDQRRRPSGKNRQSILATLAMNGIQNGYTSTYFQDLPSYKFVVSPEGNGVDCHRHYEALMAGCIPIIERNPLVEAKYAGCPILWTDDYSEITPAYLERVYPEMLEKVYDFSRLHIGFYDFATRCHLKECGNFWMKRTLNKVWYDDNRHMVGMNIMGGLGNQLFQFAGLQHLTTATGRVTRLVNPGFQSPHSNLSYWDTIFSKWAKLSTGRFDTYADEYRISMAYTDWVPVLSKATSTLFTGYFQDYRYVANDFVDTLVLPTEVLARYPDIGSKVFIHVRGGDYAGNANFDVNLDKYYGRAIAKFPGASFVIFTNDEPFLLTRPWLEGLDYTIVRENELDTLVLMSKCAGAICANSTFSWWGAWLNRNRTIVFPSRWVNPSAKHKYEGLYFPGVQTCEVE
jgi:hypothetical protein